MGLPRIDRRSLLKYASVSGLASLATACLSQNVPTTATATPTGGVGQPAPTTPITQQESITWTVQSGWAGQDIFQELFLDWKAMVEEMSGGRIAIDALPVNAVTNISTAIDAVHAGTLDGAHHVPAYYYGKDHAVSLMGTGPMMGMSGQMWLAWYYHGGGEALFVDLVQRKLSLNIVSLFHMPMQNQPLGWFNKVITGPGDFNGMRFRTVGLATGIYQGLGASVVSVPGAEVAPSLERNVIDAAEFNNTTSDTVYGLPDARKFLMTRSYHQPSEILEISLNKTKYDSMPADLQAIMKFAAWAESANGEWKFMDKNSRDYATLKSQGITITKTPQSVLDAQLQAWNTVLAEESANNPEFVKILDSQKAWAQRIFPWADDVNIPTPDAVSFNAMFGG
ncbi:MAG: TRAP transporter substrate-binding protein [Candidatus Limnocylindria bacterium]